MTTTLSVKGQVVIPAEIRERHKIEAGSDFTVLSRSNGDIVLRPIKSRRRHLTLADGILALSGLDVQVERAPARHLDL